MYREFEYHIAQNDANKTILQFLQERGYSHSVIVHLKKTPESILKNGIWSYVNEPLNIYDHLKICLQELTSSEKIPPIPLPLEILYEDDDILVLNKPADMPIHPSLNNYENTLANAVAWYFANQDLPYTFRCITRLDRDTTGVTLLAKHMLSAAILSVAMQKHEIQKEYLAICQGEVPKMGTITAPIARAKDSAIERCVNFETGDPAITHYECLTSQNHLSLVRLNLETGRTHQIRVHMAYLGHPLIGDFLYNPNDDTMPRQALHCHSLRFTHPITGEAMHLTAPLPDDMQQVISQ